jgi:hypothetical protein
MATRKETEEKFIKTVKENQLPEGFIRNDDHPVLSLTSEQKVILNRKANIMFNNGNIEDARRIYITTGYSDGLTRVGNYYLEKNESLKALKVYFLAHNSRDSEPIYENIAKVISKILED